MNARFLTPALLAAAALAAGCSSSPTTNEPDVAIEATSQNDMVLATETNTDQNVTTEVASVNTEVASDLNTPQHNTLRSFAGSWEGQVTVDGVETAAAPSRVLCVSSLTFGRYLNTAFSGQILGEPFQAVQTWGYNTGTQQFEASWIDNASTGIGYNVGESDATGRVFTMNGEIEDPASGQKSQQRSVTTLVDNDHYTMELFALAADGSQNRVMSIAFTRMANAPTAQAASTQQRSTSLRQAGGFHRVVPTQQAAAQSTTQQTMQSEPKIEVSSSAQTNDAQQHEIQIETSASAQQNNNEEHEVQIEASVGNDNPSDPR